MADAGWDVIFLAAPFDDNAQELAPHSRIAVQAIPKRPSHAMGKAAYARYIAAAARLALCWRPAVVYASDPLGAAPGLVAARLARGRLVYHEHDNPDPDWLRPSLARVRAAAARGAELVIFPNAQRARIAQAELGFPADRLRVLWNMPRLAELPPLDSQPEPPLILYYHGNISPDRLPLAVVEAVRQLGGRVWLRFAGYEWGTPGHVQRLLELGGGNNPTGIVHYVGQVPRRADLVAVAARAHVGLAFILAASYDRDLNMRHMTGASNKAFDYMAAGLALLVSDQPDWREMFVGPGYARACDPTDPASIATALAWFVDHPAERRAMGASGRAKIATEWNYDSAFEPIISVLTHRRGRLRV
jgi:glycosyltransferase involved in cell wall biosynthesis